VTLQQSLPVHLRYGSSGELNCELDASRVAVFRPGPRPRTDVAELVSRALASPLDLPTLDQAVLPDDHVVIALDRHTPGADEVVSGVWSYLERRGVDPGRVTILQPADIQSPRPADPRKRLPASVRNLVGWKIHDPAGEHSCSYLATTTNGQRIYLARELVEADFVLPVGTVAYDSLLGYRGTNSVLYPGLSDVEAIRRTVGQGHQELSPRDQRPLRQLVDEIAWLLGIQFCVQVIASDGGGVIDVVAGGTDPVFARSREKLDDHWMISMPERVDTVVVAISDDVAGHGWAQVGRALATARRLVASGGRIVILSELTEEPGEGIQSLRDEEFPEDGLRRLREATPIDLIPATQLVNAAGWARLYLLSRHEDDLVEDLFMYPLESRDEVIRLLQHSESCAILGGGQHTFGLVE